MIALTKPQGARDVELSSLVFKKLLPIKGQARPCDPA